MAKQITAIETRGDAAGATFEVECWLRNNLVPVRVQVGVDFGKLARTLGPRAWRAKGLKSIGVGGGVVVRVVPPVPE